LGVEFVFLVEGADELLWIEHFVTRHFLNVAGGDFAFFVYTERKFFRLMAICGFEFYLLKVEYDVGHVFDDARQSGELVLRPSNFYRSDGSAFERRKQNAP